MAKFNFENVGDREDGITSAVLSSLKYYLPDQEGTYAGDLHSELFNTCEDFIYYSSAEKACEEIGTFWAIGKVVEYEKVHFGEVCTDISNSCKVANMLVYMVGAAVLSKSEHLDKVWNTRLTKRDLVIIRRELNEYFDSLNGRDLIDAVADELV